MAWVSEGGLSIDDDLSYLREFEHLVFARVLMARGQRDKDEEPTRSAMMLLERLEAGAEAAERSDSLIEVLVLQAVAHERLGDAAAAQVPLERALTLAEPEGYFRMFVDEGAPMASLLTAAVRGGIAPAHAAQLLRAVGATDERSEAGQALVEPLSQRELEVLRLLATELDGPSIARELVVGVSTVRSHTKSIYAKLAVNSRRAAVRRGEELGLLSRASTP